MRPFEIIFWVASVAFVWFLIGFNEAMSQAYDRGLAVECPGKLQYQWECEGENK